MSSAAQILGASYPRDVVDRLTEAYDELCHRFILRDYLRVELEAARFAEAAFRLLEDSLLTRPFTPLGDDLPSVPTLVNELRQVPGHDRLIKIDIPIGLQVLYTIRNRRNVAHVSDQVRANECDATVAKGIADWILAELVRREAQTDPESAAEIVDDILERRLPFVHDANGIPRVLYPSLACADQVLALLYAQRGQNVSDEDLLKSVEYSNASVFRNHILHGLHRQRMIEYNADSGECHILPPGISEVEDRIIPDATAS